MLLVKHLYVHNVKCKKYKKSLGGQLFNGIIHIVLYCHIVFGISGPTCYQSTMNQ